MCCVGEYDWFCCEDGLHCAVSQEYCASTNLVNILRECSDLDSALCSSESEDFPKVYNECSNKDSDAAVISCILDNVSDECKGCVCELTKLC